MAEFDNINGLGEGTVEAGADAGNQALKQAAKEVSELIKTNPEYVQIRNSRCQDLKVERILGFGDNGTLVDDTQQALAAAVAAGTVTVLPEDSEEKGSVDTVGDTITGTVKMGKSGKYELPLKAKEPVNKAGKPNLYRKLRPMPENVGYIIHNVSQTPIEYTTQIYTQNDMGKYEGTEVKRSLMPGESVAIAREYLNKLALAPEFNLVFKNGSVIFKKASAADAGKSQAELLKKPYFQFSREEGADVNSPDLKDRIDEIVEVNGEKKSVVRAEYAEVFGYLNNTPEKAPKAPKAKKNPSVQPTKAEITAQWARNMLNM